MSSVFLGIKTDQIRLTLEDVDAQAEAKLQQILSEVIEIARSPKYSIGKTNNLYFVAGQIALSAYKNFQTWAAQTFTVSPSKELAEAWVRGSYHYFEGPRSVQKEIRQILSNS